jgi:caa(3)-type oxidase subunit IV
MTDSHAHSAEGHAGPTVNAYLIVFGALAVFTLISFAVNAVLGRNFTSFAIILGVAVCKAVLVAMIFMHLKWDWGRLFFMIIPVLILGTMMIIVLLPDIVLSWLPSVNAYGISGSADVGP